MKLPVSDEVFPRTVCQMGCWIFYKQSGWFAHRSPPTPHHRSNKLRDVSNSLKDWHFSFCGFISLNLSNWRKNRFFSIAFYNLHVVTAVKQMADFLKKCMKLNCSLTKTKRSRLAAKLRQLSPFRTRCFYVIAENIVEITLINKHLVDRPRFFSDLDHLQLDGGPPLEVALPAEIVVFIIITIVVTLSIICWPKSAL